MQYRPLRFLHAAGLQLDRPIQGTGGLTGDARRLASEAPLLAMDRLVELALSKDVDFVLLNGETFDAKEGSLAAELAFRRGAERLAAKEIPLIIAPGLSDPAAAWADVPSLPANVEIFRSVGDAAVDLTANGSTYCSIVPVDDSSSTPPPELERIRGRAPRKGSVDSFIVGVICSRLQSADGVGNVAHGARRYVSVQYLAHSGRQSTELLPVTEGQVHAPPVPVPFRTRDVATGVSLVDVDSAGRVKISTLSVSPVRRYQLVVDIDALQTRSALVERMFQTVQEQTPAAHEKLCLVHWTFRGESSVLGELTSEAACDRVARQLADWTDQLERGRWVHQLTPRYGSLAQWLKGDQSLDGSFEEILEQQRPRDDEAWSRWQKVLMAGADPRFRELASTIAAPDLERVAGQARQLGHGWLGTTAGDDVP